MWLALLACAYPAVVETAFSPELHEAFTRMPRDEFVRYFNSRHYSWKMADYEEYRINGYPSLGTILPKISDNSSIAYKHDEEMDYRHIPANYDTRKWWGKQCPIVSEIHNQNQSAKWCNSSSAFASVSAASDRLCMLLNKTVRLSELDLECCEKCLHNGGLCIGGRADYVYEYYVKSGLVTQRCKPYDTSNGNVTHCSQQCVDSDIIYDKDKHHGKLYYHIVPTREDNIRMELLMAGPFPASFRIYEDFFTYKGGIYEHAFGKLLGGHSVKVMGYGVENGVKYWLAANSWGRNWGENGTFKVKRYAPDLMFEKYLFGVIPEHAQI